MKKYLFVFLTILAAGALKLQAQVTFNPAVFTPVDGVTITIDVTGTPMAGETEAFIWIFSNPDAQGGDPTRPQRDGVVNGQWGNSSDAARLTSLGNNRWSFTFTGTDLFGLTPAQLKSFGFLLKTRNGSKQTPDFKPFPFAPLVFVPTKMRVFPAFTSTDGVIGLNFDQSLAEIDNEKRMTPTGVEVAIYAAGGTTPIETKTFTLRKESATIWAGYFIPSFSFNTTDAALAGGRFTYRFVGTIPGVGGANQTIFTETVSVPFTTFK